MHPKDTSVPCPKKKRITSWDLQKLIFGKCPNVLPVPLKDIFTQQSSQVGKDRKDLRRIMCLRSFIMDLPGPVKTASNNNNNITTNQMDSARNIWKCLSSNKCHVMLQIALKQKRNKRRTNDLYKGPKISLSRSDRNPEHSHKVWHHRNCSTICLIAELFLENKTASVKEIYCQYNKTNKSTTKHGGDYPYVLKPLKRSLRFDLEEEECSENVNADSSSHDKSSTVGKHSRLPVRYTSSEKGESKPESIVDRLSQPKQHMASKIPISGRVVASCKASTTLRRASLHVVGCSSLVEKENEVRKRRSTVSTLPKAAEASPRRTDSLNRSRLPIAMGNKPTHTKAYDFNEESTRQDKKVNKKKTKYEDSTSPTHESTKPHKTGRARKIIRRVKHDKTPVSTTASSGYSSSTDHLVSTDSLFRSTVLALLPSTGTTYNNDAAVVEAFETLVHHWKSEYSEKCIATEALAVVVKQLLLKQVTSDSSHAKSLSDVKEKSLHYDKHLLQLLSSSEETDIAVDDAVDVRKDLEMQIMKLKDDRDRLHLDLVKLRIGNTRQPVSPSATSPTSCCYKCKDVSAEVESLQIVLDMKKKEVQRLNIDRMKLLQKIEKYYELEKKFEVLSRENEAMSVVLETKSKFERQLSVELDSMAVGLEKETRKVAQLSMEKEELLWRASNGSLSLSTPDLNHRYSTPPLSSFRHSTPRISETDRPITPAKHCSFTIQEI